MNPNKEKWIRQIHIEQFGNASKESNPFWVRSDALGVQSFESKNAALKNLAEMAAYARTANDQQAAANYETVLEAVEQF